LISGSHKNDTQRTDQSGPITIGDNVWIGINVTVVGPVEIGDNVIIGANSLVTSDLPSNGIYGGIPAKPLRSSA
jgi:maltose O-acetyltransferase